jgi:hypothetical protein
VTPRSLRSSGRELDAAISVIMDHPSASVRHKVMPNCHRCVDGVNCTVPPYSSNFEWAMGVVESMRERGYGFSVEWSKETTTGHVCFSLWTPNFEGLGCEYGEFANTQELPAAICHCALAALPDAAADGGKG